MRPVPYLELVPAIIFWTLCGLFLVGELLITVRSRQRGSSDSGSDPADRAAKATVVSVVVVAMLGAFVVAGLLPATAIAPSSPGVRLALFVVGVLLLAGGIGLRQWAIHELGRFFTLDVRTVDEQPVVDTGPYRLVSHPSYTGALLTYLGVGLALGNWVSILLLLVPLPGYIARIKTEERELGEQLGRPYRAYLDTHRRLVPGIW